MLIVAAIGSFGTLIGIWFVYHTLVADHDWRRREYSINLLIHWNDYTADHAKMIEEAFPHIRDVDHTTGEVNELTREQAKQIYTCGPDNKNYWDLRFHIVELLNHLEAIVTAYNNQVADRLIITKSIKEPLTTWLDILKNFLTVVEECEGYQPWLPFIETVSGWERPKQEKRKPTA